MRVKRQKRHRKVVRFYSACFGFREPYKVLCDGTFIHHLLVHGLTPADDSLSHLLGARVLLFTTRCIVSELKSLGESHIEAVEAANQLLMARCDHEKRVSAETCLHSIIGESNSEHFFLATEDCEIRKKFQEVPGVPLVYGIRNSLFLEQPSLTQQNFVKSSEEKRLHMNDLEYKCLYKRELKDKLSIGGDKCLYKRELKDKLSIGGVDYVTTEDKHVKRSQNIGNRASAVLDKVRFKRKRAKAPNPLSCKRKKQKENTTVINNQDTEAGGVRKKKRSRRRKRDHKETTQ